MHGRCVRVCSCVFVCVCTQRLTALWACVGVGVQCAVGVCERHQGGNSKNSRTHQEVAFCARCALQMMPKKSTAGIPGLQIEYETRCIECDDHGDCDPGQYCYKYDGTCSDADNQLFICHEESAAKLGTCQDKEDDVFGTPCGTSGCVSCRRCEGRCCT